MDADELLPSRRDDPLTSLVTQSLDGLSVDELDARVVALEGEILRTKARRQQAVSHKASAEALFGRG